MVYTSSTLALAALETLVHFDSADAPRDLIAIAADIPEDVAILPLSPGDLPAGWRRVPAPLELQDLGTRWARDRRSPVLAVASAVIPEELNYLLNPLHPAFRRIRVGAGQPFHLDPRLRPG